MIFKGHRSVDSIHKELGHIMWDFVGMGRTKESCGGHFREEHQTPEGEALRHDDKFSYVACWKYTGEGKEPELIKEDLNYQFVKVQTRNYKS